MGFQMDTSGLSRAMFDMQKRQMERMTSYAQVAAKTMEADAKVSAPWSDHTGNARGGISGNSVRSGSIFAITLSGSVRYMVYLELAHGKKWAILWPTMQKHQQQILDTFARIGGMR